MSVGTCATCGGRRKETRMTKAGPRCYQCTRVQQKRKPNYMAWHKRMFRGGQTAKA